MEQPIKAEAEALAETFDRLYAVDEITLAAESANPITVLSVPKGRAIQSVKSLLDEYRMEPERKKGTAVVTTLESFIKLTKRFADDDSALFAKPSEGAQAPESKLIAVLDYNRPAAGSPRFGEHRVVYRFPTSPEWDAWMGAQGAQFSQEDFAQFIEDHLQDVLDPSQANGSALDLKNMLGVSFASPQRLMELSRGLALSVELKLAQHVKRETGEATLTFQEEHKDTTGAPIKVPGAFLLAIPVFDEGHLYQIPVRLRYKVQNGKVVWSFALYRWRESFRHAFREACTHAQAETLLPLVYGLPES